ncbi:hemolysin family protein [Aquipuribacter sp. SD81]|uniref:hemolysin family protein n=1 Tax=Aquipuribacter sp. SD81 TaxID=3127703 RepID=UPI00301AF566
MTEWVYLGVALLLVALNGLFVAAEFSLVTVERGEVEDRVDAQQRGASGVLEGLRTLSTQLSGAQLGITVTSLLVGFLAEPSLAALLRPPLTSAGLPEGAVPVVAITLALVVATGFQMIVAELFPKNVAIAQPFRTAVVVVPLQRGFTRVAGPLIRFLNGNANWLLRRLGVEPQEELASARSPEELQSLVRRSAEAGTLEPRTATLLERSLSFADRTAADVLTARGQVHFVERHTTLEDVVELSRTTGHSRFPVTGSGGSDDVVGVVSLRTCLRVPEDQRAQTRAVAVMDAPVVVPESVDLDDLLVILRTQSHLALVVDEYGGTAGVVTLEDLVEELVGEVEDEHDAPETRYTERPDGSLEVSGLLRPDELRDLGIPAEDDSDYDTLGGLVVDRLGRLAETGDEVDVEGWRLHVVAMDGMRVETVRATPPAPGEEDGHPDERGPATRGGRGAGSRRDDDDPAAAEAVPATREARR